LTQDTPPLPQKKYGVVYCDPAWQHQTFSAKGLEGRPQHYPRMSIEEISALPVGDIAEKDCWLFMWITGPHFVIGSHLPILKAWGFKPSGIAFTWVKTRKKAATLFMIDRDLHIGQGYTTRKNAEFCILARRGKPKRLRKDIHEIIISPLREHSRKPEEAWQRIEQFASGPYIELNSRTDRDRWDHWGNQVGMFKDAA
jgi:N6-adenosine-specific RNA methylase IME4